MMKKRHRKRRLKFALCSQSANTFALANCRRARSPDNRPSEPCSPSDTPYDTPTRIVIPRPRPTRQQTSHEVMSSPERLTVPGPPEMREPFTDRTPPTPTSPTTTTRPPISVNTRFNKSFLSGYPEFSQISPSQRTPVSPDDYAPRPILRACSYIRW
ncbi:hypothetical protein F4604DRAFT_1956126 [Suillus subluteus]|nr:hypothetical protein F4604DRAFT_1956126 [Suillus subluteus]